MLPIVIASLVSPGAALTAVRLGFDQGRPYWNYWNSTNDVAPSHVHSTFARLSPSAANATMSSFDHTRATSSCVLVVASVTMRKLSGCWPEQSIARRLWSLLCSMTHDDSWRYFCVHSFADATLCSFMCRSACCIRATTHKANDVRLGDTPRIRCSV
ncbi:hypothetical protein PHLGIDRAFT_355812 [Phlebiopsis gigantea 11061_1 CR5-6]|uniref:Secreted protein n=1 Tax=Phlebiopsis gigantea (strain 11061_1 CR5-6) TaxID=745531 RepID=A0A0C3RPK8_PHLG1|nr:hypothetical protein PHLGIDRAFT_355812 [Phlebiopsis gigantea 11061_1 CR5-6]